MNLLGHNIGVCSWSLKPLDMADLIGKVGSLGLSHVQLALGQLSTMPADVRDRELGALRDSGITLTATMVAYAGEDYSSISSIRRTGGLVPDELWDERRKRTLDVAAITASLGVKIITTHGGFIPAPNDANYETVVHRIVSLAAPLADLGLELLMETGQETASELLQFLNNLRCKNFGINFDPANMILYGSGDPLDAIKTLGRHIRHVHVKDAIKSAKPGVEWGKQVPFGDGEVPHDGFIRALRAANYTGPLVIECEGSTDGVDDAAYAIETLQELA